MSLKLATVLFFNIRGNSVVLAETLGTEWGNT